MTGWTRGGTVALLVLTMGCAALVLTRSCQKPEPQKTAEPPEKKPEKKLEKKKEKAKKIAVSHWPNGARLVVSVSMQFETGGQPQGAESPFSGNPLPHGKPDLAAESWFRYGAIEGVERLLRLFAKHKIHVTSHVVGAAAQKYPEVAKAIAAGGHEIAAHGMSWENQWNMTYATELAFVKKGVDAVEQITGQHAVGYNCNWLRRSPQTLQVLQEAGFLYHIDDLSHDEPFLTSVRGKPFVVIPYTLRNNDIVNIEGRHMSAEEFKKQLQAEFDVLYQEGSSQRRMMSVSLHDRIGGTPAMVKAMDGFLGYALKKEGVVFLRKDEIAKLVIDDPKTPHDESEAAYNGVAPKAAASAPSPSAAPTTP